MFRKRNLADDIDRYRIKSAQNDQERLEALEAAIGKAVDRAQMNYFWITLSVAVLLVTTAQALKTAGLEGIPEAGFKWSLVTMTLLVVLPWQLRKLRALP